MVIFMRTKKIILKVISKLAMSESKKSVNTACPMMNYQIKEPKEIKKLRKF